jgi:hypothetical protein
MYVGSNKALVDRLIKEAKGDLRLIERAYAQARHDLDSDIVPESVVISNIHQLNGKQNGVKP